MKTLDRLHFSSKTKVAVYGSGLFFVGAALFSIGYVSLAIFDKAFFDRTLFLLILTVLVFLYSVFLFLFWKNRNIFSVNMKIRVFLLSGAIFWFWIFAPIFDILTINASSLHFKWIAFNLLWELLFFIVLYMHICLWVFKPIQNYLVSKKPVADPAGLYRKMRHYPFLVVFFGFIFIFGGYMLAIVQYVFFAFAPPVELFKTVFIGLGILIFMCVFYYLYFDNLLSEIRVQLKYEYELTGITQRKFSVKIFGISTAIIFGVFIFISLLHFQASQNEAKLWVSDRMEQAFGKFEKGIDRHMDSLKFGERGSVYVLEKTNPSFLEDFSPETRKELLGKNFGIIQDLKGDIKLVGFFVDKRSGNKIVSIVRLSDFYGNIFDLFFFLSSLIIAIIAVLFFFMIGKLITAPLISISQTIKTASENGTIISPFLGTDDEFELLTHTIYYHMDQSKKLQFDLAEKFNESAIARAKDNAVLASIGEALVVTDVNGKIILTNKMFENVLGLGNIDLQGRPLVDVMPLVDEQGDLVSYAENPIAKIIDKNITTTTTTLMYCKRKDNTFFPVTATVSPIHMKSTFIGVVVVFRDITKEQDVDKARTDFISLVSHQLRTPLTTIRLLTEEVLTEKGEKYSALEKDYLTKVYAETKVMIELVSNFLTIARLNMGKVKIESAPEHIEAFCEEVIMEVALIAAKQGCEIIFEKPPAPLPLIVLDKSFLRQILYNFLTNAVRYTEKGKGHVQVKAQDAEGRYILSVTDNGIGIPKEVQSRIFERFFRADNARELIEDGTGLGLYTAKMMIKEIGGEIGFTSEGKGKGSTFFISLQKEGMRSKDGEVKMT